MLRVFASHPLVIQNVNSCQRGNMQLADDNPVLHIVIPNSFLTHFLHKNYALNTLVSVFASYSFVIHQVNSHHYGNM